MSKIRKALRRAELERGATERERQPAVQSETKVEPPVSPPPKPSQPTPPEPVSKPVAKPPKQPPPEPKRPKIVDPPPPVEKEAPTIPEPVEPKAELEEEVSVLRSYAFPSLQKPPLRNLVPVEPEENIVAVTKPSAVVTDQFRNLRRRIEEQEKQQECRSLLVTSGIQGDGKTTVAINLAVVMAQVIDRSTVLVDGDLRTPKVHEYLGFPRSEPGLSDILAGRADLDSCLLFPSIGNLHVIPAGVIPDNPSELVASAAMDRLLADLKRKFDYVLVDSGSLHQVVDPAVLSEKLDGVIVVVRARKTSRDGLLRAVAALGTARVVGIVLNAK